MTCYAQKAKSFFVRNTVRRFGATTHMSVSCTGISIMVERHTEISLCALAGNASAKYAPLLTCAYCKRTILTATGRITNLRISHGYALIAIFLYIIMMWGETVVYSNLAHDMAIVV